MRPIFNPSARTRLVSPSAVLSAAFAGMAVAMAAEVFPSLFPLPSSLALVFGPMGFDVGALVASTLPGARLTAATSPVLAGLATAPGTGLAEG